MRRLIFFPCALLLSCAALAHDEQLLVGQWTCEHHFPTEQGLTLHFNYHQLFTAQGHFSVEGDIQMRLPGQELAYALDAAGNWSLEGDQLSLRTETSQFRPNNPTAQQLHDAGILNASDFDNMQGDDVFQVLALSASRMQLEYHDAEIGDRIQVECFKN
ncbi:hypothetical protein V6U78_10355 [Marinospirillum sp. MEB164]|uniref:Uncharacterized protein n=1 Tax=Marinospirillum alkalitolerans TaxID=3123374 RepID=A0ABW8PYS8_9GAMM